MRRSENGESRGDGFESSAMYDRIRSPDDCRGIYACVAPGVPTGLLAFVTSPPGWAACSRKLERSASQYPVEAVLRLDANGDGGGTDRWTLGESKRCDVDGVSGVLGGGRGKESVKVELRIAGLRNPDAEAIGGTWIGGIAFALRRSSKGSTRLAALVFAVTDPPGAVRLVFDAAASARP